MAGRTSELPARGRGAPGRAGPRGGCSRRRVGDSCARSIPAPALAPLPAPRRAAPLNPHRSRAEPPAALSANTKLVCAGASEPGARGRRGVPWGPASSSLSPSSSASAGPGVPGTDSGENSTPTTTIPGGWSRPGPGWSAGRPGCGAWARTSCQVWKVTRRGEGTPGLWISACSPPALSTCFRSLCAPGIACRSRSWVGGLEPRTPTL